MRALLQSARKSNLDNNMRYAVRQHEMLKSAQTKQNVTLQFFHRIRGDSAVPEHHVIALDCLHIFAL
jgi:hypothetical protein